MNASVSRFVDHSPEGPPIGRCVILPGTRYTPDGPLLFFAAQVALARGWEVRQVWWEPPAGDSPSASDEIEWVSEHLDAAIGDYAGRVLVVAKSLGTLSAARAAARALDAAWLTPLLDDPQAAGPLLSYPSAQFVLIGADDPYLDRDVFDALPGTTLLVPGDHVLGVPGNPTAMVSSHEQFVRTFDTWVTRLQD